MFPPMRPRPGEPPPSHSRPRVVRGMMHCAAGSVTPGRRTAFYANSLALTTACPTPDVLGAFLSAPCGRNRRRVKPRCPRVSPSASAHGGAAVPASHRARVVNMPVRDQQTPNTFGHRVADPTCPATPSGPIMSPMRHIRLRLSLPLIRRDIKRLEARAAGE